MKPLGEIDFFDPAYLIGYILLLFAIVFVRYLLFSGAYHFTFYSLLRKWMSRRIIDKTPYTWDQLKKELYWSCISAGLFAVIGIGTVILWQRGYTAVYSAVDAYPIWYIPISVFLVLFIHDTYYYWLHRWMHRPRIYRYFHEVHHKSIHASVFTSFSFHPLESFMQAIVIPIIIMIIPIQVYALLFVLLFMTLSATINHAGVEIYPLHWHKHWLAKWFIGASHHDRHHRKFLCNYGLYFTLWDRWMDTEDDHPYPQS